MFLVIGILCQLLRTNVLIVSCSIEAGSQAIYSKRTSKALKFLIFSYGVKQAEYFIRILLKQVMLIPITSAGHFKANSTSFHLFPAIQTEHYCSNNAD